MNENVAIIVQARLGSTRLPGKILKPLNGYPVLEHVLQRCAAILGQDKVICAGVDSPEEASVRALSEKLGFEFFAGSETDVLSRYYLAAKARGVDWVVRVTSDCPLLDPQVCRDLIERTVERDADYGVTQGWPHGLDCEIVRFGLLERAFNEAVLAEDREHVTLWIKVRDAFNKIAYTPKTAIADLQRYRWVLDYPEDLTFLRRLFAALDIRPTSSIGCFDVLEYLATRPQLLAINAMRVEEWAEHNRKILLASEESRLG